jgi:hypothetical protein
MMFGAFNGAFAGFFACILLGVFNAMGWWTLNPIHFGVAMTLAIINLVVVRGMRK